MTFNRQKAFDTAVKALRKQGERAMSEAGGCVYRATNGHKCAIGHLIPDRKYDPAMEGDTILGRHHLILPVIGAEREDMLFLGQLQQAHDLADTVGGVGFLPCFLAKAKEVADRFGLDGKACA